MRSGGRPQSHQILPRTRWPQDLSKDHVKIWPSLAISYKLDASKKFEQGKLFLKKAVPIQAPYITINHALAKKSSRTVKEMQKMKKINPCNLKKKVIASSLTQGAAPIPPRAPLRPGGGLHNHETNRPRASRASRPPATPICYKYNNKCKHNNKYNRNTSTDTKNSDRSQQEETQQLQWAAPWGRPHPRSTNTNTNTRNYFLNNVSPLAI